MASINYIAVGDALTSVFRNVRFRKREWPRYLHHYTNEKGFRGIVASNRFWATSAAFVMDKKEILYGCEAVARIIGDALKSRCVSPFTDRVLRKLQTLPETRIEKTFLACFCARDDLLTCWALYGEYEVRFPVVPNIGVPLSPTPGFVAQMYPAIYDRDEQEAVLREITDGLITVLEDKSLIADCDFGETISTFVAFNISEFMLDVIVCFKDPAFRDEREWRLVARPRHRPFSSDLAEGDRNCEYAIESGNGSKPHIKLSGPTPVSQIVPQILYIPLIPMDLLRIGPFHGNGAMKENARQILDENRLQAVSVVSSEIPIVITTRIGFVYIRNAVLST